MFTFVVYSLDRDADISAIKNYR